MLADAGCASSHETLHDDDTTTTGPACLLPACSPTYLPLVRNIAITPLPAPPPPPPPSYLLPSIRPPLSHLVCRPTDLPTYSLDIRHTNHPSRRYLGPRVKVQHHLALPTSGLSEHQHYEHTSAPT